MECTLWSRRACCACVRAGMTTSGQAASGSGTTAMGTASSVTITSWSESELGTSASSDGSGASPAASYRTGRAKIARASGMQRRHPVSEMSAATSRSVAVAGNSKCPLTWSGGST